MIGLEGNKDPEEPEKVQNTRYLVILDDRKYGRTAKIPLFYDVDTGVLAEPPEGFLEDETCQTLAQWREFNPTPVDQPVRTQLLVTQEDSKESNKGQELLDLECVLDENTPLPF